MDSELLKKLHTEEGQRQLKKAFGTVFSTDEGKLVLAALKDEYYDNIPHTDETNMAFRYLGQRDVVRHILDLMEITHE